MAAKNYGRMGMAKEATAIGGTALKLAKALAVIERLMVMRNLVEAFLKH